MAPLDIHQVGKHRLRRWPATSALALDIGQTLRAMDQETIGFISQRRKGMTLRQSAQFHPRIDTAGIVSDTATDLFEDQTGFARRSYTLGRQVGQALPADIADIGHDAKGVMANDGQLVGCVITIQIRTGIGLGKAQSLGLRDRVCKKFTAIQRVEDEIARPVHDALDSEHIILGGQLIEMLEDGGAAADGRRVSQVQAVFTRKAGQKRQIKGDDGLVGGDQMTAIA